MTAAETLNVQATGASGQCTAVPSNATGVSMNVTSIGPTAPTFLTIWAAGETRPLASSLNPVPGEPPTPNAVTSELSSTGQFSIYNLAGTVNVLVDINGYYIDHDHDDSYAAMPAFGFIAADGTPSDNTVGVAADGVDATTVGTYEITLDTPLVEGEFAATVTPACPGFVASAAFGTGGTLVVTIEDAGAAAACGFSFTVADLPAPPATTTTTSTTSTTSTTTTTVV